MSICDLDRFRPGTRVKDSDFLVPACLQGKGGISIDAWTTGGGTYGGEEVARVVPCDGLDGILVSCQAEDGRGFLLDVPDLDLHAPISS